MDALRRDGVLFAPAAWNEIGFGGPAYPRGYKNLGVDKREPFEVRDAHPADDPVRAARTR